MKADLHVHSKYSKRPSEWVLKKLGCPESFTEPTLLYKTALSRGMSQVTITDHNCIDGCLQIAHLPYTFISEEVTSYFPEDGCKLHVLVHNIDEAKHREILRLRENVYELVSYLNNESIFHALAHPFYSINKKLTVDHFERALLLFKNFEINCARSEEQNACLQAVLSSITELTLNQLIGKHGIMPQHDKPWEKNLISGSDDHSSLTIARGSTQVEGAQDPEDFFQSILHGKAVTHGPSSTPHTLAHNIYSIAYQFYGHKFNLQRYVEHDEVFEILDHFLKLNPHRPSGIFSRFNRFWGQRRMRRASSNGNRSVVELLRTETRKLICDDPHLSEICRNGNGGQRDLDKKWFSVVNRVSNAVLCHSADHIMDSISGANFFNLFNSLGSAGALYSVLAPYFVAFSVHSDDKQFTREVHQAFFSPPDRTGRRKSMNNVAHFTDTFYEVNGVAGTLKKQIRAARRAGKQYTVITCDAESHPNDQLIHNFEPIRVYELSVYPEQKLFFPPFLEMLDYCHKEGFTHIHSATPGPLGLAALAIARILKLPIVGTYHTALPQYAHYLTGDGSVEDLMWKYIVWYYDQMHSVYVPSRATAHELIEKGIPPHKVRIFPRGVDTELFHPSKRNGLLTRNGREGALTLLYVGRVSKEKNLEILVKVFKSLTDATDGIQLVVVGDGPYLPEMREALADKPVHFTGYLEGDRLAGAYASCDLFVFPSTTDTFGNVVLEAQASGIPVVVTDQGGPQENIVPGETGFVVRGNDEESLLRTLQSIMQNTHRLKLMGAAARRYAEKRSFDQAFEQAWELYSETTEHFNGRPIFSDVFASYQGVFQ